MNLDTIFETERLILQPFRRADARDLHVFTSDPQAMRFMSSSVLSYEATLDGLKKNLEVRFPKMIPLGFRAVVLKDSDIVIGDCGLHHLEHVDGNPVEITYHLARPYWCNGYATEAAQRLVHHAFLELCLDKIVAAVNPDNVGSVRVAEKLGLRSRRRIPWPQQGLVDLYVMTHKEYDSQTAAVRRRGEPQT